MPQATTTPASNSVAPVLSAQTPATSPLTTQGIAAHVGTPATSYDLTHLGELSAIVVIPLTIVLVILGIPGFRLALHGWKRRETPANVFVTNFPEAPSPSPVTPTIVSRSVEAEFRPHAKTTVFTLQVGQKFTQGAKWSVQLLDVVGRELATARVDYADSGVISVGQHVKKNDEDNVFGFPPWNDTTNDVGLVISRIGTSPIEIWHLGVIKSSLQTREATFRAAYLRYDPFRQYRDPAATIDFGVVVTSPDSGVPEPFPCVVRGTIAKALPPGHELRLFTLSQDGRWFWPQIKATIEEDKYWHFKAEKHIARDGTLRFRMYILGPDGVAFVNLDRKLNKIIRVAKERLANARLPNEDLPWEPLDALPWDTYPCTEPRTIYVK